MSAVPDAARCKECGAPLSADEMALTRKLINRGATAFLCLDCLAAFFGCDTDLLRRKAEQFRRDGCALFAPLPTPGGLPAAPHGKG